jgi:hypothetical protein
VTVVHHTESIGQRAATNEGARISRAKYVAKLDAHCAVDEGFDVKMMEDCQPDWTMIPSMYALHAFDWQCKGCGNRTYQGYKPAECGKCKGTEFEMVIVWQRRENRLTVSWRFDNTMRFKYWKEHAKRLEARGQLIETMTCIGCCFFMERERFWNLGGMDEQHGSWGQFGSELACKAWLSGGRMITTKKTWMAHMFRSGNFRDNGQSSFPYNISGADQERAREYSRDLWLTNSWPLATRKLEWLIDHFKPVPSWHDNSDNQ